MSLLTTVYVDAVATWPEDPVQDACVSVLWNLQNAGTNFHIRDPRST
jgi:hypothetical protein